MAGTSKGGKFPLLIYQRWAKMLRLPSLLITITAGGAWWFDSNHPLLAERDWLLLVISGISTLIFFYSLFTQRASYVQCLPKYVKIRTPFLSLVVSYKRILKVRPIQFHSQLPLADMKPTQRRLLSPFLGNTVILLELSGFPVNMRQLRLWVPWFMSARETTGFILVVEDWMALSQQISAFSDRWIAEQARQRRIIGRTY